VPGLPVCLESGLCPRVALTCLPAVYLVAAMPPARADPLKFCKDDKSTAKYTLNEIQNGRLAMLAFSGMVTQAVLTGHGFPYLY